MNPEQHAEQKKEKKHYGKSDPSKPDSRRGKVSAYLVYCNDRRQQMIDRHEYPDASSSDRVKIMGEEWHKLP